MIIESSEKFNMCCFKSYGGFRMTDGKDDEVNRY